MKNLRLFAFATRRSVAMALYHQLRRRNIITAPRGDRLRISPHFYNTPTEIDELRQRASYRPSDYTVDLYCSSSLYVKQCTTSRAALYCRCLRAQALSHLERHEEILGKTTIYRIEAGRKRSMLARSLPKRKTEQEG